MKKRGGPASIAKSFEFQQLAERCEPKPPIEMKRVFCAGLARCIVAVCAFAFGFGAAFVASRRRRGY